MVPSLSSRGRCENIEHNVFQPEVVPGPSCSPSTRVVQVELTLYLFLNFRRHNRLTNEISYPLIGPFTSKKTLRFDLHVFRDRNQASQTLFHMLSRVLQTVENELVNFDIDLDPNYPAFNGVIDEIIRCGVRMAYSASNMRTVVLPLQATVWGNIVQHQDDGHYDEEDMMEMNVNFEVSDDENEEEEIETGNYSMVPAEESSVRKMLKKVRAEDGDCMICLEELKSASDSDALQMPCSHDFHTGCIETWLKRSHYCPVCRFEMPT